MIDEREMVVTSEHRHEHLPDRRHRRRDARPQCRHGDVPRQGLGRDNSQLYAPAMNAQALERLALENMLRKAHRAERARLSTTSRSSNAGDSCRDRNRSPDPVAAPRPRAARSGALHLRRRSVGTDHPDRRVGHAHGAAAAARRGSGSSIRTCGSSINLSARQFQQLDLVDQMRRRGPRARHRAAIARARDHREQRDAERREHDQDAARAEGNRRTDRHGRFRYRLLLPQLPEAFPDRHAQARSEPSSADVATDPSDAAIVSAVITMAHSLNLEVVAEGVETDGQLSFLQGHHCDIIQGFLFSPPLAVDAIEPFLAQRKGDAAVVRARSVDRPQHGANRARVRILET